MRPSIVFQIIISIYVILVFNSCREQPSGEDCRISYRKAKSEFNRYYKNQDTGLLDSVLYNLSHSMNCKETRLQAVSLRISTLVLLKNYKAGYEFIDTLQGTDFDRPYKKNMYYKLMKALEYENKGDTVNAKSLYSKAINPVNNYIQAKSNDGQIDQDAYYDLYFIKAKLISQDQIGNEIDGLIKKYPSDKDFLIALKSSFR